MLILYVVASKISCIGCCSEKAFCEPSGAIIETLSTLKIV
jgi:hypothetical protein